MGLVCAEWGYRRAGRAVWAGEPMLKAFLLIVVGLAGDPEHGKMFHKWGTHAGRGVRAARRGAGAPGLPGGRARRRRQEGDRHAPRKDEIAKALEGSRTQAGADDVVFVVLIGHGSFDGRAAKFNLPGPDMTRRRLQRACFKKLPTKQIVFVNTASASGPFVDDALGPGPHDGHRHAQRRRAVRDALRRLLRRRADVRSGRRGQEQARQRARGVPVTPRPRWPSAYEREGLLATEHALLDDNGDKEGSPDPAPTGKDGKCRGDRLARRRSSGDTLPTDPKLRALYLERRDLERRVEALRLLKDSMEPGRVQPASSKSW